MAPDMDRVGHSHAFRKQSGVQPVQLSDGLVWPHDNAIIAMGFKFYGFAAEAARIAHDISVAAEYFRLNQLPGCIPHSSVRRPISRCNTSAQTYRRPGGRVGLYVDLALLGFLRMRHATSSISTRCCRSGRPTWPFDLRIGKHKLDIRFGARGG
jgi:hypothetical protein